MFNLSIHWLHNPTSIASDTNLAEAERVLQLAAGAGLTLGLLVLARCPCARASHSRTEDAPRQPRAGRPHCIDETASACRTYLLAGWDSERSLDDIWVYLIVASGTLCRGTRTRSGLARA